MLIADATLFEFTDEGSGDSIRCVSIWQDGILAEFAFTMIC